jgi:hypothetical protein
MRFTKSDRSRDVFKMIEMVQKNYEHYSDIHKFMPYMYRNDYALTIALRTVNGQIDNKQDAITGRLIHAGSNLTIERNDTTPQGTASERSAAYFPLITTGNITSWSGNGTTVTILLPSNNNNMLFGAGTQIKITDSGNSNLDGYFVIKTMLLSVENTVITIDSNVNGSGTGGIMTRTFKNTTIENCISCTPHLHVECKCCWIRKVNASPQRQSRRS